MVAFDTTSKSLCRKKVHQLCKDRFARIHQPSAAVKVAEASAGLVLNSNRSLCAWGLTFSISITYSQRSNKRWDSTEYRLGFRDVASSTNEHTMIMTVLPPHLLRTHTLSLES